MIRRIITALALVLPQPALAASMFGPDNTALWAGMAVFIVIAAVSPAALAIVSGRIAARNRAEDHANLIEERRRQDRVASLLVASNEAVAAATKETISIVKETAAVTRVVHTLVNSKTTEGLETERRLSHIALALLVRMPAHSQEDAEQADALRMRIGELDAILVERAKQLSMVEVQTENIDLRREIDHRDAPGA